MTDLHSAWRSTEPTPEPEPVKPTVVQTTPHPAAPQSAAHIRIDPSMQGSMKFAALTGVLLVTMSIITFYFGVDFLRASLTGSSEEITVTITEEGVFDPESVTLYPGDTLKLLDKNSNPQVIKSRTEEELFPVQVMVYDQTYSYNVPLDADSGEFIYFSETLPEDIELRISIVSDDEEEVIAEDDLLIPDLGGGMFEAEPEPEPVRQENTQPIVPPYQQTQQQVPVEDPFAESAGIEVNPYTVGNKSQYPQNNSSLHGGAPIKPNYPRVSGETGPGVWLFLGLSLFSLTAVYATYRRKV